MKFLSFLKLFGLTILLFLSNIDAFAQGSHVGGGDQCKNEIDKHRIEILGWIQRDEAKGLDFSKALTAGLAYMSTASSTGYKERMLEVLQPGKVIITCYLDPARITDPEAQLIASREGVSYRAITVGELGQPSTCINYEDANQVSHIDCNYDLIMNKNSLGNPDYINTHHEFASIAAIEQRDSNPSDFSISKQLSQYEHITLVKVLGPKKENELGSIAEDNLNFIRSFQDKRIKVYQIGEQADYFGQALISVAADGSSFVLDLFHEIIRFTCNQFYSKCVADTSQVSHNVEFIVDPSKNRLLLHYYGTDFDFKL